MERPRQHEIDDLGQNLLRGVFAPRGWVVREIPTDYGLDFEIEIFNGGKSTGAIFKVQLKSSENTRYSADGQFLSQALNAESANYLCRELRLPVILLHADVAAKRVFWTAPQLATEAIEKLVAQTTSTTITIRIATANELPARLEALVETIGRVETLLASKVVADAPVSDFLASIDGQVDKDGLSRELRDKSDALKLQKADELFLQGRYAEARERVQKVINDPDAVVESKFWAWCSADRLETVAMAKAGAPQAEMPRWHLTVAVNMQKLTRKGPAHLKFYALIARKAAELDILTHRHVGLVMNWKAHQQEGDPFWRVGLLFELASNLRTINRTYNECVRLAGYTAKSKHRWALPQALVRVVNSLSILIGILELEGRKEAAENYRASGFQICRLAAWIGANDGDYKNVALAALSAMMLTRDHSSEQVQWARDTVATIPDEQLRADAERKVERNLRRYRGEKLDGDVLTSPGQAIENMASAIGIDLSDPNSGAARAVRLGITDLDPSRVLKNCEHIFVTIGSYGLLGHVLKVPTVGSKIIHCVLHTLALEGVSLDTTYQFFQQKFCSNCADASPRPPGWRYSEKWQQEENERREAYMKEFNKRTAGRRE
jgi:hypothetical protein